MYDNVDLHITDTGSDLGEVNVPGVLLRMPSGILIFALEAMFTGSSPQNSRRETVLLQNCVSELVPHSVLNV